MTEVIAEDGSTIVTDLPADKVADLQAPPAPAPEPATDPAPPTPAVEPKTEDKPADPPPVANPPAPEAPKGKVKPIATLLSKLNEERTAREAAERRAEEAEARATQAQPVQPSVDTRINAVAEKHGIAPEVIADILALAPNQASNSALPKEVQELIAERAAERAHNAELAIANTRITKLASVFKDEPIAAHKDKILELAYSEETAPDGERYCDKELSELYFGFIKPEVEPGKPSAEPSRGGAGPTTGVMDFAEIHGDDAKLEDFAKTATTEQWTAYTKWRDSVQGDIPIRHAK